MISRLWRFHFVTGVRRGRWFALSMCCFLLYAAFNVGILGRGESQVTFEGLVILACYMILPAFVPGANAAAVRPPTVVTIAGLTGGGLAIKSASGVEGPTARSGAASVPNERIICCDALVASPMHRFLGACIDAAYVLIAVGLFLVIIGILGFKGSSKTLLELSCGVTLLVWLQYNALWMFLAGSTPGMRYVRLELVTFDGGTPDQSQRALRYLAQCLSILSGGLGIIWTLVDQEALAWHDHISKTFPSPVELRISMSSAGGARTEVQMDLFDFPSTSSADARVDWAANSRVLGISIEDLDQLTLFPPRVVSIDTARRSSRARFIGARHLKPERRSKLGGRR